MKQNTDIENMPPISMGKAASQDVGNLRKTMPPPSSDEGLLFNALLYPNRSLPNKGFIAIMALIIGVNLFASVLYTLLGAWPVVFFCGLDALAVWVAFKLSYKQGRLHERIMLTSEHLWISRALPSGHETRWQLPPYWTNVSIDRPIKHESQLRLTLHGKTLILGHFLSPKERGELADALEAALIKARQNR